MVVCVFEFFRVAVLALTVLGVLSLGKRGGLLHMSAGSFCCAASCFISTSNFFALRVLPYCHAARSPRARSRGDVREVTGCKPGRTQKNTSTVARRERETSQRVWNSRSKKRTTAAASTWVRTRQIRGEEMSQREWTLTEKKLRNRTAANNEAWKLYSQKNHW